MINKNSKEVGFIHKVLLPSEYQQVEYIESTGTQYIDTNFIPNQDTKIMLEIMPTETEYCRLYGAYSGSSWTASSYGAYFNAYGNTFWVNYNSDTNIPDFGIEVGQKSQIYQDKNNFYVNNVLKSTLTEQSNFSPNTTMYIMALNREGESRLGKFRLYNCKIWNDDVLVRNLIPCYRKSDNVIGMYDLVNGVLYINQGTGTFTKGNNVGASNIDKVYHGTDLVFEQGFTREQTGVPPLKTSHPTTGKNLKGYKIYGNSVQNGTPTPSNPVKIQSVGDNEIELPSAYKQVEYIGGSGTQYIDTDFIPNMGDEFDIEYAYTVSNHNLMTLCSAGAGSYQTVLLGYSDEGFFFYKYFATGGATQLRYTNPVLNEFQKLNIKSDGKVYINDTYIGQSSPVSELDGNKQTLYIMARREDRSSPFYGNIKRFTIKRNNNTVLDLIPCYRKSDNVIGMYDLINNNFLTNAGSGTFTKGNDVNGYKIPVKAIGKNLFNKNNFEHYEAYVSGQGVITSSVGADTCIIMKVQPSTTYIVWSSENATNNSRLAQFITKPSLNSTGTNVQVISQVPYLFTFTTASTTNYIAFHTGKKYGTTAQIDWVNGMQVEYGSSATTYEAYQEADASVYLDEPLRKLGDYADYIDFESQKVYRKIKRGIITENSTFSKFSAVTDYSAFWMTQNDLVNWYSDLNINQTVLSPTLKYYPAGGGNANASWSDEFEISSSITSTYERIIFSLPNTINDVAEAKVWLQTNPIEYYYPTEIVTEQSITLPNISSFKGTTTYEVNTTIQPSNMYIKYKSK